ncbi:hypothetical protein E2C01_058405 [Portunus trituberculatus]|uniref:Uncharacterized protein n=1 Tax=Portunus trituberculatus TaxID=210409 RepID=A0A5B7H2K2_PORTR|nr:hypothetical protein [Portunus trituberculatus]
MQQNVPQVRDRVRGCEGCGEYRVWGTCGRPSRGPAGSTLIVPTTNHMAHAHFRNIHNNTDHYRNMFIIQHICPPLCVHQSPITTQHNSGTQNNYPLAPQV